MYTHRFGKTRGFLPSARNFSPPFETRLRTQHRCDPKSPGSPSYGRWSLAIRRQRRASQVTPGVICPTTGRGPFSTRKSLGFLGEFALESAKAEIPLASAGAHFDAFSTTAARMSAWSAFSLILSPSWMSMARRVLPSRLELKRPAGSLSDAPLAKVSFTLSL